MILLKLLQEEIQILNIMGFVEEVKTPIPIFIIPLTHKNFELYNKIFYIINNLLEELKIVIDFDNIIFVAALKKSIITNFTNSNF